MNTLLQDLRYGARMLLKKPGFTLIALFTLALGIGANTAIFSVVNAVLLRPLSYPQPDRIVTVFTDNRTRGFTRSSVSLHDYRDWEAQNQVFAHMAAYNPRSANVTGGQEPERVDYALTTAGFFSVLGAEPALGRAFLPEDDQPGRGNVVVLSHGYWRRSFNSDANVIGRTLQINGETATIIGVMPAHVQFPDREVDLWKPVAMTPESTGERSGRWLQVVARLKPEVKIEQAEANMQTIAARLARENPESNDGWGVNLVRLQEEQVSGIRPALLLMWGAVGLVLLIACANVASLMLARAAAREQEIAIRRALGAGTGRIIRQLLTESLVLALLAGLGGCLLAIWGTDVLPDLTAGALGQAVEIDRRLLFYVIGISLVTGILSGIIPALKAAGSGLGGALREGGRSAIGSAHHRTRNLLVVCEIALTLVLLVGAGLLLRSFVNLMQIDPGFDPHNLLTLRIAPPQARPAADESREEFFKRFTRERSEMAGFYRTLVERVEQLPGVESAGAVNVLPLSGNRWSVGFNIEGRPAQSRAHQPTAFGRIVTPKFLQAMKTGLLAGRELNAFDTRDSQPVALISQSMARRHWPDESPVGRRIRFGDDPEIFAWVTVVGVVSDMRVNDLESEPDQAVYIPFDQAIFGHFGDWGMTLVVRSQNDPASLTAAVRAEVQALDRSLPLYELRTMEQVAAESIAQRRSSMLLLGTLAALALILAVVGVYGVISFAVSQRTQEIGIRLALGAQKRDVLRLILTQGLKLTLAGVAIGLAATFALTHLLTGMLYGVGVNDPFTLAAITVLLSGVALVACYLPARRATRVDPLVALRYE